MSSCSRNKAAAERRKHILKAGCGNHQNLRRIHYRADFLIKIERHEVTYDTLYQIVNLKPIKFIFLACLFNFLLENHQENKKSGVSL